MTARHRTFPPAGRIIVGAWLCALGLVPTPNAALAASARWTAFDADAVLIGRVGPAACFDSRRERFVIVAGLRASVCIGGQINLTYPESVLDHTLETNMPWTATPPAGEIPAVEDGVAVYDSLADRIWHFGGQRTRFQQGTFTRSPSNALHALDPATMTWRLQSASGTPPPRAAQPALVLDTSARRLIVMGGRDSLSLAVGGVFATPLANPGAWSELTPAGPPPPARWGACAVYDPDAHRVLLVGGVLPGPSGPSPAADAWELDLAGAGAWRPIATTGDPPTGRCWGGLDRVNGRLIVFGDDPTVVRALDLATGAWGEVTPTTPPPDPNLDGESAAAAFDPIRVRFLFAWPTVWSRWCHGPVDAITYALTIEGAVVISVPPDPSGRASFALAPPSPTPARDEVTLSVDLDDDGPVRIEAFDLSGRRQWIGHVTGAGRHRVSVDVRGWAPGVAFVRASHGAERQLRRAVIVR